MIKFFLKKSGSLTEMRTGVDHNWREVDSASIHCRTDELSRQ
jgi:hypothetical protein